MARREHAATHSICTVEFSVDCIFPSLDVERQLPERRSRFFAQKSKDKPPSHQESTMVKCAVNGFGRIGRLVFRYAWEDPTLEIVHVNDLCSCESAAYLVKYDSVHGTWNKTVEAKEDGSSFCVDDATVTFSREKDFTKIDFAAMGVELVMECTGHFLTVKSLSEYFDTCGVKQVVVSAPVKEDGCLNVVLGCNHEKITKESKLVTNASCTTNCLAPVVKVIQEKFGTFFFNDAFYFQFLWMCKH
jgi:glyceraldehyde 3-phosphate dehydrogenase